MNLIICGNGALGQLLWGSFQRQRAISAQYFDDAREVAARPNSIAIHCGSGRQLESLLTFCENERVPLIQASSGQTLPGQLPTPVIDAPNLAIPMLAFLKGLPEFWKPFLTSGLGFTVSVAESHQCTKKSVPETAKRMAKAVGFQPELIASIRSPVAQQALGVLFVHLPRHGCHWVTIEGHGVTIQLATRINGLQPYVDGARIIAERVIKTLPHLHNRLYSAAELIWPPTFIC